MKEVDIKKFFYDINRLKLNNIQKKRMMRILQVRGSNKKNTVMTYHEFKNLIISKQGKITRLVLGPKWNRLIFVDVDFEV